jgi:hypothetical protein
MSFSRDGKFVYALNGADQSVTAFSVDAQGSLALLAPSQEFAVSAPPQLLGSDRPGKRLVVAGTTPSPLRVGGPFIPAGSPFVAGLTVFGVDATGALTVEASIPLGGLEDIGGMCVR